MSSQDCSMTGTSNLLGSPSTSSRSVATMITFLDLPADVISQIASHLTLEESLQLLSLHPFLLSLNRTHLSPLPSILRTIIASGPPYPPQTEILPSLTLYQPDDGGHMYLPLLVRARPRWILERLQHGRWKDTEIWKEAFQRRFLRSWERYKGDNDTWRAAFLRVLAKLEHRYMGCTHEESWTRFITLHRNGSASINRIYSRMFDPYDIYDELKHQNNFASEPTQVRVLLHLSDIRILAIGVLHPRPSLFVNPNAHLLLHPPLLRSFPSMAAPPPHSAAAVRPVHRASSPAVFSVGGSSTAGTAGVSPSVNGNEAYYPLVRSLSPSGPLNTTYGLGEGSTSASSAAGNSNTSQRTVPTQRRSTLGSLIPGRRKSFNPPPQPTTNNNGDISEHPEEPIHSPTSGSQSGSGNIASGGTVSRLGAMLTQVRSRDSDDSTRQRKWSFGRTRNGSISASTGTTTQTLSNQPDSTAFGPGPGPGLGQSSTNEIGSESFDTPSSAILSAMPTLLEQRSTSGTSDSPDRQIDKGKDKGKYPHPPTPPRTPTPPLAVRNRLHGLPYPRLTHPEPAPSHRLYPNYTPEPLVPSSSDLSRTFNTGKLTSTVKVDNRSKWEEVPDDTFPFFRGGGNGKAGDTSGGKVWRGDSSWPDEQRMAEWDPEEGVTKRWVGPMIIVAQLFPCDRIDPHPVGANPDSPIEGPNIDLGPKGTYASLTFEDLDSIMGWVELKGGGANGHEARRPGMGFE